MRCALTRCGVRRGRHGPAAVSISVHASAFMTTLSGYIAHMRSARPSSMTCAGEVAGDRELDGRGDDEGSQEGLAHVPRSYSVFLYTRMRAPGFHGG